MIRHSFGVAEGRSARPVALGSEVAKPSSCRTFVPQGVGCALAATGLVFQFALPLSLFAQKAALPAQASRSAASVSARATVLPVNGGAEASRTLERLLAELRTELEVEIQSELGSEAPTERHAASAAEPRIGFGADEAPWLRIENGGIVGEARRSHDRVRIVVAYLGS